MNDPLPIFTAARIAHVLGRDKRGLLRILQRIPASGKVLVQRGQLADAWRVESLPSNYLTDLGRMAKTQGCRNIDHLLSSGSARWLPPIRLSEIAKHHISHAVRVKNALSRALSLHVNAIAGMGEIRQAAHDDYQKEFGTVCERTVRRVFDRVITRDSGDENFDDLALYLGERISAERADLPASPGLLTPGEQAVHKYLSSVKTPSEPAIEELDLIWFTVCEEMHDQLKTGEHPKAVRRSMVALLQSNAVHLSRTTPALKKLLKLKYARFVECGGDFNTMSDQRAEKSGWRRALTLSKADRDLIVGHAALQKGGRIAPAFRELRNDGKLSRDLEIHHISDPSRKSYVPCSIRAQVQPDVRRLKNMEHGPRTHRLKGAFITRDYTAMSAGDWYQADDVTLPVYFYEESDGGPARMRGQFLVMIDVRTDYVLGFLLISERNYDSLAIRSLITICGAKHGLPRRGFYFERGIWKSSKIISGVSGSLPFEHADRGLRGLGMELRHAQLPRAKVIERTIGQIQNRMEAFPGYVGRDERNDVRERTQRQFLDADSGRRPMDGCLLSKDQYCEELAKIINSHNEERQEGRLDGLSPIEAWEKLQGDQPRQGFSNKWRYVLARDVRKIKVGRNGITLRYGKKAFVYRGLETGERIGEEILAWFDPMFPDILVCTDLDKKNVFSLERAHDVPAFDAPAELLAEEMKKIDQHQAHGKTLYWTSRNVLKEHHYAMTIADSNTLRIGSEIAAQSEGIATKNDERRNRTRKNRAIIERGNLPTEMLPQADRYSTETVESLNKFLNSSDENSND